MAYDPVTDFLALWRYSAGQVSKIEMPGLDYVVAALARAGLITLSVSATAPVANQDTTAWLHTAVPSYSAEGALFLWDASTSAYAVATPELFFRMLQTTAGQNGTSWFETTGGPPSNIIGNNGDYAMRTDEPGGIYGPKDAGAWPANPVPGTTDIIGSEQLDLTFGNTPGLMLYRGLLAWQALPIGDVSQVMVSSPGAPAWEALSSLFDTYFGGVQGSLLYRAAAGWVRLNPGAAGQVLATGGAGADMAWAARTAEFPSGTVMLFRQTAAPTGWTKQTALNDYGLRVTSGAVGSVAGSAFSTVFAQTVVGDTTLSTAQIPAHGHALTGVTSVTSGINNNNGGGGGAFSAMGPTQINSTTNTGGGGPHGHAVNLTLSYLDVIIATKN